MNANAREEADAPLRRNVRLLGAVLGNGVATEAARALIDHAFETTPIDAVTGPCRVVIRADDLTGRVLEFGGCSVTVRESAPSGAAAKGGPAAAKGGTP